MTNVLLAMLLIVVGLIAILVGHYCYSIYGTMQEAADELDRCEKYIRNSVDELSDIKFCVETLLTGQTATRLQLEAILNNQSQDEQE